jgi:ferredoxin
MVIANLISIMRLTGHKQGQSTTSTSCVTLQSRENHRMAAAPTVLKSFPMSEGLTTPRKKKPKELAVITECCTGCAGSPACVPYCPVAECMYWIPDEDHPPFGRIEVDPYLCIGCKKCTSKGPDGAFLDGCPWDAIDMVAIEEVEAQTGVKFAI